jgi:hypothetical protein
VIYIFRKLDRNSSGFIEESELAKFYKCSNLPEILDGAITPKAKSKELVQTIGTTEVPGGPEGRISVDQFIDYYLSLSLVFKGTDEEFRAKVLSEWRVESGSSDNNTPPQPTASARTEVKHPAPPSTLAPSSSRTASPRVKMTGTLSAMDESELDEDDAPYRQLPSIINPQNAPTLRRGSADHDPLTQTHRLQALRPQSPHHQNRFSPNMQQPQPRYSSTPGTKDQSQNFESPISPSVKEHHQHFDILTSPVTRHQVQGGGQGLLQQQQQLLQPSSPLPQVFISPTRTTDQAITDNLRSLMVSLQQKILEQQATIESQQQIMFTQQQMLSQLQALLDQQRQPASQVQQPLSPPHQSQLLQQQQQQQQQHLRLPQATNGHSRQTT